MRIALVLLVRNERPCLEVVLPAIPRPGPDSGYDEVVAVDGGSVDGSVEFLEEHGIPVIAQTRPGRGAAILEALGAVEADAHILFSPDGNEAVEDLPRFRPLLEGGADIVIASRMMTGARNEEDGRILRWRKWANNAFNLLANLFFRRTGPFVTDSINGYRAITRNAADALALDALDYTIEYQMTMRAMRAGLRIVEFPTVEGVRIAGETGASSLPTGLRFVSRLWRELRRPHGGQRMNDTTNANLDYQVVVTRSDGQYTARIRELLLVETDDDLDAAYTRLEERKRQLIADHERHGALGDLPPPAGEPGASEKRQSRAFAVKTGIVALAAVIVIAAAALSFTYAVREPMRTVGIKLGRAMLHNVEKGLADVSRKELTPERRQKIRLMVADAVPHLEPYVVELRPLVAQLCERRASGGQ